MTIITHLLDVRHAAGQVAVVVVVEPSLDCGQVHGLRHNLEIKMLEKPVS